MRRDLLDAMLDSVAKSSPDPKSPLPRRAPAGIQRRRSKRSPLAIKRPPRSSRGSTGIRRVSRTMPLPLALAAGPRREFFPAAFYLGAAFAAAGRDRDAAGIWQLPLG